MHPSHFQRLEDVREIGRLVSRLPVSPMYNFLHKVHFLQIDSISRGACKTISDFGSQNFVHVMNDRATLHDTSAHLK